MEKQIALRDANQRFAQYVRAVEAGESFVITRRGRPIARLVPIESGRRVLTPEQQAGAHGRWSGCGAGSIWESASSRSTATRSMSAERYSIDTNLLVYAVDRREGAKHTRALDLVDRSVERDCVLTAQSLAEFVAVASRRRMLGRSEALAQARDWMKAFSVVTATTVAFETAFTAFEAGRFGLWDALLLATAREAGCTIVLSEDMQEAAPSTASRSAIRSAAARCPTTCGR